MFLIHGVMTRESERMEGKEKWQDARTTTPLYLHTGRGDSNGLHARNPKNKNSTRERQRKDRKAKQRGKIVLEDKQIDECQVVVRLLWVGGGCVLLQRSREDNGGEKREQNREEGGPRSTWINLDYARMDYKRS